MKEEDAERRMRTSRVNTMRERKTGLVSFSGRAQHTSPHMYIPSHTNSLKILVLRYFYTQIPSDHPDHGFIFIIVDFSLCP